MTIAKDYASVVKKLLNVVIEEQASDLHLSSGRHPIIRVNTELIPLVNKEELTSADIKGILQEFVGAVGLNKFLEERELDFSYHVNDTLRLRGNAYVESERLGMALRSIGPVKPIEELNLPPILKTIAEKKQGFFLVVGPVGQGKSTTLAAIINEINQTRKEHIVTIEQPIEYLFPEKYSIIHQRAVGIDTESFDSALHSVFRQDVNVIMVGEMRGADTISTAVTAAETGHLVFSTLHTNNAAQTIDRVIDAFPPTQQDQIRTQLASSLLGIFSQRLIPTLANTLIPAYELLLNNNAVANMIRERRTHEIQSVIETSSQDGMISMNQSLYKLVRGGSVALDTALKYSLDPEGLQRML